MRVAGNECRGGHDLARLAVAALNDLPAEPSILSLPTRWSLPNSFDRSDRRTANAVDGRDTGARRRPVQMNRTGAAERHAAAELRAGHAEHVAHYPQERGVTVDIDRPIDAVDLDRGGQSFLHAIRADRAHSKTVPCDTIGLLRW